MFFIKGLQIVCPWMKACRSCSGLVATHCALLPALSDGRHVNNNVSLVTFYQRGATDPPNGGVFQMFPLIGNCQTQFQMVRLHSSWVWLLPMRGPMLNRLQREPYFSGTCVPDLTIPCTNLENFIRYRILLNCNKNEGNGWVVGVLWGFEPFSHGNHHNRA